MTTLFWPPLQCGRGSVDVRQVFGKRKELGSFATEEDAARCYDKHAVLAWGARYVLHPSPAAMHGAGQLHSGQELGQIGRRCL